MAQANAEELNAMMLEICGTEFNPIWVNEYKTRCKTVIELCDKCQSFSSHVSICEKDVKVLKDANFSIEACKVFRKKVLDGRRTPPLELMLNE